MTTSQHGCPRCADLDDILDTLTETIRRLTEHPTETPEQPAAGVERPCGHQRSRVGGGHLRCVLPAGHVDAHDNGRGVMWARTT